MIIKASLPAPVLILLVLLLSFSFSSVTQADDDLVPPNSSKQKLAYIVLDLRIPFWKIMGSGV